LLVGVSVTAYRIVKSRYSRGAFSGFGAHRYGGRWNTKGHAVVYTSESLSLALLEVLVHLPRPRLLANHRASRVAFSAKQIERLPTLPRGWRTDVRKTRALGDEWLERGSSPVLEVPSVLFRWDEFEPKNYLLNPLHAEFGSIDVGRFRPLEIDPRIR
jgi:RES domain-containing protein